MAIVRIDKATKSGQNVRELFKTSHRIHSPGRLQLLQPFCQVSYFIPAYLVGHPLVGMKFRLQP